MNLVNLAACLCYEIIVTMYMDSDSCHRTELIVATYKL